MATPIKKKNCPISCVTPVPGSPVARNVSYQEVVHFGRNSFHRSFSFGQVWTPGKNGHDGTEVTQIAVSNFQVPPSISHKRKKLQQSWDNAMAKKSKKQKMIVSENTQRRYKAIQMLYWAITIGATAFFSMYALKPKVWPLSPLERDLMSSLFGQNEAITQLVAAIDLAITAEQATAIVLTGTVGVGKSFASSLVQAHFPWQRKITFVTADKLSSLELTKLATADGYSLLVIEDCNDKNSQAVVDLLGPLLNHARRAAAKLIALFIYTHRTPDELQALLRIFPPDINSIHIPFAALGAETVMQCFRREIENEGVIVPSGYLDRMVRKQMEYVEEVRGVPGCKGVNSIVVQFQTSASQGKLRYDGQDDEL